MSREHPQAFLTTICECVRASDCVCMMCNYLLTEIYCLRCANGWGWVRRRRLNIRLLCMWVRGCSYYVVGECESRQVCTCVWMSGDACSFTDGLNGVLMDNPFIICELPGYIETQLTGWTSGPKEQGKAFLLLVHTHLWCSINEAIVLCPVLINNSWLLSCPTSVSPLQYWLFYRGRSS